MNADQIENRFLLGAESRGVEQREIHAARFLICQKTADRTFNDLNVVQTRVDDVLVGIHRSLVKLFDRDDLIEASRQWKGEKPNTRVEIECDLAIRIADRSFDQFI